MSLIQPLSELALQSLETACNAVLAQDPAATAQLAAEHGRSIGLKITNAPVALYAVPNAQGQMQLYNTWEGTPDCVIHGNLFDLLRARDTAQASHLLFTGQLQLEGDVGLGQRISRILGNLQIDWEEHLSEWIGDTAAYHLGQQARQTQQRRVAYRGNLQQNIADYLTEEIRLTPHAAEIARWSDQINALRDDTERLNARLTQLEQDQT